MYKYVSVLLLLVVLGGSCRPPVYPPKPTGYYKIDTPEKHEYKVFERAGFPYSFEYPVYCKVSDDTTFQTAGSKHPYWINIYFPTLGGEINITYKEITAAEPYMKLVQESDGLTGEHMKKADNIIPKVFQISNRKVSGILYTVLGDAATRYQFTATDSVKHFLRGALYFNVTPNADSLKPVTDFVEKDIQHLLETLAWH